MLKDLNFFILFGFFCFFLRLIVIYLFSFLSCFFFVCSYADFSSAPFLQCCPFHRIEQAPVER